MKVEKKEGKSERTKWLEVEFNDGGMRLDYDSSFCVTSAEKEGLERVERVYEPAPSEYVVTLSHEELGRLLTALGWNADRIYPGEFSGPLSEAYRSAK